MRCQVIMHCISRHPAHDSFPDKGRKWKQRKSFVTEGCGRYRFYDEDKDKEIYEKALEEDTL